MKDSRSFFITIFALILITISIVIVSIWGYRVYFGEPVVVQMEPIQQEDDSLPEPDSKSVSAETLPVVINDSTEDLDDSDTMLQAKLEQLNQLQNEIKSIINKKSADETTDQRIEQLQVSISQLERKNNRIEVENKKLVKMVNQLASIKKSQKVSTPKISAPPPKTSEKISAVTVTSLNVFAGGEEGNSVTMAAKAKQLKGSFIVKTIGVSSGELDIVILKPDGKVLLNAPWESGVFETSKGKKIYSIKLNFNRSTQQLYFSIDVEAAARGIYTVQVFYHGEIIAAVRKTLS